MSSSNCRFLTCIQISQEAGQVVWYSHLFQKFPQFIVIHTVKGFGIVNKAEINVFLELSCFFNDPVDVGNLISGSSAFSNIFFKFKSNLFQELDFMVINSFIPESYRFLCHDLWRHLKIISYFKGFFEIYIWYIYESESYSLMSNSLQPHGLYSSWNSPGQNTGVGSCSFLQGIVPMQGSNPGLPHCRRILY